MRTAREGRFATKQWRWNATLSEWTKISYEAGSQFTAQEHSVHDLAELVQVLDAARRDPRAFVVRGALSPDVREQVENDPSCSIRRRKHAKADKRTGHIIPPTLVEAPRRWIMVDIDGWPLPSWADLVDDPEAAIEHAVHELLPETFRDAQCWWQLSSSAGFAAGVLKVHLFYWLSEPAENVLIKAVLKQHAPGVDRAPFSAAQPHYIADPIIDGGHDPLPRRVGWLKGLEPAVQLPPLQPVAHQARAAGTGATGRAGDVLDALALLGDGEGLEGFHGPLRVATLRYARHCARYGDRNDDALKQDLQERIKQAPRRADRGGMSDYDDAYLQRLIDGAFALVQAGDAEIQTMRPHHAVTVHTVEEARAVTRAHIDGFLSRALDWHGLDAAAQIERPAEHAAVVTSVGVGKSRAGREALAGVDDDAVKVINEVGEVLGYISRAKAEGRPDRVLWLVPTRKLGRETLAAMRGLSLNVAALLGRNAPDPEHADFDDPDVLEADKARMCLNLPAVEDAMKAGYDVERAACGSGKEGEPSCSFHSYCPYQQRQKPAVAQADVVVTANPALFHRLSAEATDGLGLVIADESWWQVGLHPKVELLFSSFAEEPVIFPVLRDANRPRNPDGTTRRRGRGDAPPRMVPNEAATADLHTSCLKVQAALGVVSDGGLVAKADVIAAGLTAEECDDAARLEWARRVEGAILPGMSPQAREKALERAAGNIAIGRRVGVWKALAELLRGEASHTGRLAMGTRTTKAGADRVIHLNYHDEVREELSRLPMLLLDATMPVEVVRHYLPRLEVLARVQADAPHMDVTQVIGGWGKTSLTPNTKAKAGRDDPENKRRSNLVGELADFVRLNSGDDALVVTYQAIEQRFAAPGVRTEHFNNIAGLDVYGDVRAGFIIGRPHPDAETLRDMALALTGRPIMLEVGQNETRGVLMADGTGASINVRTYADPDMEALRVAITDAEVVQAVGRGRGSNRTADNPLRMFIFANVALPLPVTKLVHWDSLRLDVISRMAARGRVLLGPADAVKAYPEMFPTPDAARMAIQKCLRDRDHPKSPLWRFYIGGISDDRLTEVEYRPAGHGQKTRRAWIAPDLLRGLPAWLVALLQALLVHYAEHIPNPPPPPPMAEKSPVQPRPPPDATPAPLVQEPTIAAVVGQGWRPAVAEPEEGLGAARTWVWCASDQRGVGAASGWVDVAAWPLCGPATRGPTRGRAGRVLKCTESKA